MLYKNKEKVSVFKKDTYDHSKVKGPRIPKFSVVDKIDYTTNLLDGYYYNFLGHSSIFLKLKQYNILIDPVFTSRLGPFKIVGSPRFKGVRVEEKYFPSIDIVCITHNHFDHLDIDTLKEFDYKTSLYIVPKGVKKTLTFHRINKDKIVELDWDETYTYEDIKITCLESHHNAMRYFYDKDQALWCSYRIEDKDVSVYHSGDSAFSGHFERIHEKYNDFDLVFIECGQYNEKWHNMHMFPEESAEAAKILNGKLTVPIHWGAYCLSIYAWNESIIRFDDYAKHLGLNYQIPELNKTVKFK